MSVGCWIAREGLTVKNDFHIFSQKRQAERVFRRETNAQQHEPLAGAPGVGGIQAR